MIAAMESDGQLTIVEMYVVEYALEKHAQLRTLIQEKLNILLFCLMVTRKTAGKKSLPTRWIQGNGFENPVCY